MIEIDRYLTISEFASLAGVSKQAVYKQASNKNSQLSPFVCQQGKRTLIKAEALKALYEVDLENSTLSTQNSTPESDVWLNNQPISTASGLNNQPEPTPEIQPIQPKNQPDAEDYIAFLKAEIADLKDRQQEQENRHAEAIAEKDRIIQEQAKQLADLCQQVADIAQKALTTTAQQQYLMAYDRKAGEQKPIEEATEQAVADEEPAEPQEQEHKGFFARLKAWFNNT